MKTLFVKISQINEKNARATTLFLCVILLVLNHKYVLCVSRAFNRDSVSNYNYFGSSSENQSVQNNRQYDNQQPNFKKFNSTLNDKNKHYKGKNSRFFVDEHELPTDVPVKIKIHGNLATPLPHSGIHLGFVPKQTYYQVRRYDTELHLPKSAAHAEAETVEELINAPRLREIVSHKKTQEVYEEQGYEDAAYDHGGYKKAGEHHENISPGEQETDYSQTSNHQAERVEVTDIKKEDDVTLESSQMKEPLRTASKERNRIRNRKPKFQGSWSNQNTILKKKRIPMADEHNSEKNIDDGGEKVILSTDKLRLHSTHLPRKEKNKSSSIISKTSSEDADYLATAVSEVRANEEPNEIKLIENSKLRFFTPQMMGGLRTNDIIKPTTYRPPIVTKFLLKTHPKTKTYPADQLKSTEIREHGLTLKKKPFIDNSGYKFENSITNSQNFIDDAEVQWPLYDKSSIKVPNHARLHAYSVEEQKVNQKPFNFHHDNHSMKYVGDAQRKANELVQNKPFRLYQPILKSKADDGMSEIHENVKSFPYGKTNTIMESDEFKTYASVTNNTPFLAFTNLKRKGNKRNQTNDFPYEIIDSKKDILIGGTRTLTLKSNTNLNTPENRSKELSKSTRFQPINNDNSIFGEPDNSPWIPITQKEVYDFHGYNRQHLTPTAIEVSQLGIPHELIEGRGENTKHVSPIRVFDQLIRPMTSPTSTTSYSIQHVYPKVNAKMKSKTNKKIKIEPSWPFHPPFFAFLEDEMPHNSKRYTFRSEFPLIYPIYRTDESKGRVDTFVTNNSSSHHNDMLGKSHKKTTNTGFQDTKDIDTLSSNRYTVFQSFDSPSTGRESSAVNVRDVYPWLNNKSLSSKLEKVPYRHSHFSRETSNINQDIQDELMVTPKYVVNSTLDISSIHTNFENRTNEDRITNNLTSIPITQNHMEFTSQSATNVNEQKDDSKLQKIGVQPVDSTSSPAYLVEKLTLAQYSDPRSVLHDKLSISNHRYHSSTDLLKNSTWTRRKRNINDNRGSDFQQSKEELLGVYLDGSTTEITINVDKYPFYKNTPLNGLSKYSVIRYISNPNRAPKKTAGRMSFYESTDNIRCSGPSPPRNIVPKRENGEWTYNNRSHNQRVRNLGDNILCFKIKFFGSDPLDNPFFKEESVGFPETFSIDEKNLQQAAIQIKNNVSSRRRNEAANRRTKKNVPEKPKVFVTYLYKSGSLARKWIGSILKPGKNFVNSSKRSIRKRSTKISDLNNAKKVVHRVYLAGGFINIKNNNVSNGTLSKNILSSSDKILSEQNGILAHNWTRLGDNLLGEHIFSIPRSIRIAYGLRTIDRLFKRANGTTITNTSTFSNITKQPEGSETVQILPLKGDKQKFISEGVYTLQNPSLRAMPESTDAFTTTTIAISDITTNLNKKFNDPVWKSKQYQHADIKKNQLSTLPNPEIDSLLYVIHPKTGEGKWMKILKVEQVQYNTAMTNSYRANTGERTLLNMIRPSTAISPTVHQYLSQDVDTVINKNVGHKLCQEEASNGKKSINDELPESNMYHFNGLLKKVAPLKSSGIEINNLQTSEEQFQEISNYDTTNGDTDPFSDHKDYQTTIKSLEPHERLYYYVVDNENDEQQYHSLHSN